MQQVEKLLMFNICAWGENVANLIKSRHRAYFIGYWKRWREKTACKQNKSFSLHLSTSNTHEKYSIFVVICFVSAFVWNMNCGINKRFDTSDMIPLPIQTVWRFDSPDSLLSRSLFLFRSLSCWLGFMLNIYAASQVVRLLLMEHNIFCSQRKNRVKWFHLNEERFEFWTFRPFLMWRKWYTELVLEYCHSFVTTTTHVQIHLWYIDFGVRASLDVGGEGEWVRESVLWCVCLCRKTDVFYRFLPVILTIEFVQYTEPSFARPISLHKSIPFQSDDMFLLHQYPFVLVVIEFRAPVICACVESHAK